MPRVILFNKPFGVLCQFTSAAGRPTLKDYIAVPGFYAAGRLDADSEGLVVLTDDGKLQHRIADPRHKLPKVYWAQVEDIPADAALNRLQEGVMLGDSRTGPAQARCIGNLNLWPRTPPIRFRKNVSTAWLELTLREGKNRQVRRMTAAVGHPTLRLIRWAVGPWTLENLPSGTWHMTETGT